MRRFLLYILVALLTFGISSFIAFKFYWENKDETKTVPKDSVINTTSVQNLTTQETKQDFPTFSQENNQSEKPFCHDKRILPVWNELAKTENFREWLSTSYESKDCKDLLDIKELDLNNDGQKEILVRGKNSPNLCGGVGNCAFWIYAKQGKKYKILLSSTDYQDITELPNQIKKTKTRGYFDIVLKGHITASDTSYNTYKFNGKKYQLMNCLVNTYVRGTNPNSKWEFISCKEFYKRWENEK